MDHEALTKVAQKKVEAEVASLVEAVLVRYLRETKFLEHVVAIVLSKVPTPKDGKEGPQGRPGIAVHGKDGKDADPEAVADRLKPYVSGLVPGVEDVVRRVLPLVPAPKDGEPGAPGKDGSPDTGEQIVGKINSLPATPDKQIDASHIKNLPKEVSKAVQSTPLHRGGIKLIWNTVLDGTVNGTNTAFTVPASLPAPKDSKFIVAARGVLKDTDSGDFTVSNGNRTITFTVAPPSGSAQPRIILYHGK